MSIRALVAAMAVVALPIAVSGQQPAGDSKNRAEKRICTVHNATGSRLELVRRCMTRREREAYRREVNADLTRQQMDRRGCVPPERCGQ